MFNRKIIEIMKNNTLNLVKTEEIEIKKPCVITEYNPVEDFNKYLEEGVNSEIGTYCKHFNKHYSFQ